MPRAVDDLLRSYESGEFLRNLREPREQPSKASRVAAGDLVESLLASVGITKQRVQHWLRLKDCGCSKRQQWLNRWSDKQQDRIERLLRRAARWYGIT